MIAITCQIVAFRVDAVRVRQMTGEDPRTPARLKPENPRLLSGLPTSLSRELFAGAVLVRLPAGTVLFRAGDPGNGCYRVEDRLLKVTMVWSSGVERILAFPGRGAIVGELAV